jgi:MFS family permease
MADATVAAGAPATAIDERSATSPGGEVLRDIARGGIAGILVGIFVAGLGGRLVMRLATILHEDTVGQVTEAGETIGRITLNGTLALVTFSGLGMGLVAGTIWVIVSPWIPWRGLTRALVTAVAAIAIGTPSLVQYTNFDFIILEHDPIVVAMLIGLVGLVGFSIAIVDGALDARLPHPPRGIGRSTIAYLVVTLLGLALILPPTVGILLGGPEYHAPIRAGWALAVAGACTLLWWALRVRGDATPPRALRLVGSGSLLAAVILGFVTSLPQVTGALGLPR